MIWKKDKLKPTQPYFVIDTEDFRQELYLKQGISHFFSFGVREDKKLRLVPDGCLDIVFEYDDDSMQGYVIGSPMEYKETFWENAKEIFGVRFMPGFQPAVLKTTMKDIFDRRVPLDTIVKNESGWVERIALEKDFYQRIRIFLQAYTRAENKKPPVFGKAALVQTIKNLVYDSDGKIRIREMSENTGYSERYINRVFLEEMGFSPKTFCKFIQFQRAIEFLNYGAPDSMTDAAVALGFYDQSQFIKDFKRYAGVTPKKYLIMVKEKRYRERVKTEYFENDNMF